MIKRLIKCRRY